MVYFSNNILHLKHIGHTYRHQIQVMFHYIEQRCSIWKKNIINIICTYIYIIEKKIEQKSFYGAVKISIVRYAILSCDWFIYIYIYQNKYAIDIIDSYLCSMYYILIILCTIIMMCKQTIMLCNIGPVLSLNSIWCTCMNFYIIAIQCGIVCRVLELF